MDDLETFILTCVRPAVGDLPLDLLGHSMGGAVAAQFLVRHPETFRRAVLTSPMIAPSSGNVPMWAGHALAAFMCLIGKGKKRAFIAGPFDPAKEPFETSCSTSRARFDYYQQKRVAMPCLQVCAPSYRWVLESIRQTGKLLDPALVGAIRTRVLLCQASDETVVLTREQEQFVRLLKDGEFARFDGARHEIYNSVDATMQPYVQKLLTFLLAD